MQKSKRVKMTLLLDSETVELLKKYAYERLGETNVSKAVRFIAQEYGKSTKER